MKKISLLIFSFLFVLLSSAQRTVVYDTGVQSVRLATNKGVSGLPVLVLGSDDRLYVSFDDLTHEYRRFSYRIEHVAVDFVTDEGLFDSEYMEADDSELVIEDYRSSINTTVLYNHYSFQLPNVGMRPLLSGNYRLVVQVEDEEGDLQKAFEAYFAVVEQKAAILLSGKTDTDIDHHDSHQQLEIEVVHSGLSLRDPERELKIVVLQNGRWDNAVEGPKPTANTGNSLKWEYCRDLIFDAGNEFRKFEQISTHYSGMFVDNIRYFEPYYYATLMMAQPRPNYLYDEDQNGTYVYRADRSGDPDTEADYMNILFQLDMEPMGEADVYVGGLWTGYQFLPQYKMNYNYERKAYEALIFLKQGYYSYQYLTVSHGGPSRGSTEPIEGNYFQTENDYTVLVYCRTSGSRYDRLVGWRIASYKPQ